MNKAVSLDKPEDAAKLVLFLQEGGTVQEIYGMEDGDVEVMFIAAARYLKLEKLQEAADCFLFLTFLNPYLSKFWMGLGESYRLSKDYDKAIQTYTMASIYDYDDPRPHFHAAHCYLAKEAVKPAFEHMVVCLERCRGQSQFASLQEVCYELLDDLGEKIKQEEK